MFGDNTNGGGTGNRRTKVGTTALSVDTWYHVVCVFKGATDMDIYLNGIDDGGTYSGSGGTAVGHSGNSGGRLGTYPGQSTTPSPGYFQGSMDEVHFWNRALSAAEVDSLYNAGDCNSCTDTVIVYDTTYVTINDTNYVNVYDTTYVTVYDTVLTSVEDTLNIEVVLGISPMTVNTFKVFPNPAKTYVTIDNGEYTAMNNYNIKIVNITGQEMFNSTINQQTFDIDISFWNAGTYFINIINGSAVTVETKHIVKY